MFDTCDLKNGFHAGKVSFADIWKARDTRTNREAELEHVDGPFLLQEVHEAEEKVLLLSDFLQLQLQHLLTERRWKRKQKNRS